jgi:hypothetical protein
MKTSAGLSNLVRLSLKYMYSTPDFFVAEHYVLQNTTDWWSKDLGSVLYTGYWSD